LVKTDNPYLAQWKRKRFLAFLPLAFLLTVLPGCGGGGTESTNTSGFTGGAGTAVLSWDPPTTNTDGSPLTLTGFSIYVGTSPGNLRPVRMVGATETTTVLNGLLPGTYYFAVAAISTTGAQSALSNIASKTITIG
jgi:Fibronectin type III domain